MPDNQQKPSSSTRKRLPALTPKGKLVPSAKPGAKPLASRPMAKKTAAPTAKISTENLPTVKQAAPAGGGTGKLPALGKRKPSDRKKGRDTEKVQRSKTSKVRTGEKDSTRVTAMSGAGRGAKFGLVLKFVLPVGLLSTFLIVIGIIALSRYLSSVLVNEILKDGCSGVQMLAEYGQTILTAHEKSLKDREFEEKYTVETSEGRVEKGGKFWPVELGLIKEDEFRQKMAIDEKTIPSEALFIKGLQESELLKGFRYYKDKSSNALLDSEVMQVYITDLKNRVLASSTPANKKIDVDNDEKTGRWFFAPLESLFIGTQQIFAEAVGITIQDVTIVVGQTRTQALIFSKNIRGGGMAHLTLRADVIESEIGRLKNRMLMIGILAILMLVGVCIFIANMTTKPVKTLISDMEIVAGGNLDHKTRAHSQDEIGQMALGFNEMTRKLAVARAAEKEAERLENELDMAREIQMKLLPPKVPQVKGFDTDAVYRPAKEVGGDYYDFFPIDREHLGIIVADVSGKGIPGSMIMATTRTILRFVAAGNISAADTLAKTNAIVAADIKRGMFVTAFYLVLNARNRTLLCASAGHNPMALVRGDGTLELINPSGIALGFDKGPIFQRTIKEQKLQLNPGDRIVLYTDGVVEAMNNKNDEYTDERFYNYAKAKHKNDSKSFIQGLLADLESHKGNAEQHDDITIVTFKVED